ncbi:MAG TPA: UDP-N-acetylglucosamine 2-epimerase (non-hydrolyzing) [Planctomycetaceae bacterium]|nr:UDP-N-acetylglucosamine 2-epimerase (non-hydrolyzing) [Planctomycetaceae bacterium]
MRISLVAGARPNFMKLAPLVTALKNRSIRPRIVHTGQHYDEKMSEAFFDDLGIPTPDVNLGVGSGSHVFQIAEVMRRFETDLSEHPADAVVVMGDVNSTLAAALASQKSGIRVAHVEAGLRSFDRTMPEEINRILTDAISDWLFTSEPSAEVNLKREGIDSSKIHFVGNVMIDTLLAHSARARELQYCRKLDLAEQKYQLVTMHRPSNVDQPERLESILQALRQLGEELPTVFVVHPRTRQRLEEPRMKRLVTGGGFIMIEPLGYLAMLSLMQTARIVLTDSGGMQEETTALGIPCLTLRENTERPITVEEGTNQLVGWKTAAILAAARRILDEPPKAGRIPEKWDGKASNRIVDVLSQLEKN